MATRRAVRQTMKPLAQLHRLTQRGENAAESASPLVLVALSGGADSLALALALAHEAPKSGVRAGAVIIDHGLQDGSAEVATRAAEQARQLGLDPVLVRAVQVGGVAAGDGPEAEARNARYAAFAEAAADTGAVAIMTAHTHDDQAEQVLLGLARGSGLRSLAGIPAERALRGGTRLDEPAGAGSSRLLRPFLGAGAGAEAGTRAGSPAITRATTEAACADQGVMFWRDPHNLDPAYARVRVRERVLPMLEAELGPGVADALVRTAALAKEDADALDDMAYDVARRLLSRSDAKALEVEVADLAGLALPVLYRVIRVLAQLRFGAYLERVHTLAVAGLITQWRGQAAIYVPGIIVTRRAGRLSFERQVGSPRG